MNIVQDTEEWHQWRKSGVGASEVAAVIGVCPYKTRHTVWMEKTGRNKGFAGNSFTEHGKALESAARSRYEAMNMVDFPPACATHPVFKHCLASLDGWNQELNKLLEIKCPAGRGAVGGLINEALENRVADNYIPQVQFQMAVTGADDLDFYVYYKPSTDVEVIDATVNVKPDITLQGKLVAEVEDFWEKYVLPDIEPPLTSRDVRVSQDPRLVRLAATLSDSKSLSKSVLNQLKSDFIAIGGHQKVRCGRVQVSEVLREGKFSYHKLTVGAENGN